MTKSPPSIARARWLRDPRLQRLFEAIAAAGGEARVAGGAVRNALLGLPVADVDIATTLPPDAVLTAAQAAGFATAPTGLSHGTVTVIVDHHPFEVTTLRADVATDGRHATVAFHADWAADARRRDFTMNALYCDHRGEIYDFTDGYADLLKRRIKFVGRPSQRIAEDYLRVLRFFRFHAQFGKGAPDKTGLAACRRAAPKLATLSPERIRQELLKLLAAPGAVTTLKVMARAGILRHILPYTEDWRVLSRLPPDPILRLVVLAATPDDLKSRLRLSNDEADRIHRARAAMPPTPGLRPAEQRRILYLMGADTWRDAVHLAWARSRSGMDDARWRKLLRLADRWPMPLFPVTGHDFIAAGLPAGPRLGAALRSSEDWWIASDFSMSKSDLIARAIGQGGGP